MISREQVREVSDGAKDYLWGINARCRRSYFFADASEKRLSAAAPGLEAMGITVIGLSAPAHDDDDQATMLLHVESLEAHTVDSLHRLNKELCAFANKHGLQAYDGMDICPCE